MLYNVIFWGNPNELNEFEKIFEGTTEAESEQDALAMARRSASMHYPDQHIVIEVSGNIVEL